MTPAQQAWQALGDAVAVVDEAHDTVMWASSAFWALMGMPAPGTVPWSSLVSRLQGWAGLQPVPAGELQTVVLPDPDPGDALRAAGPSWLELQRVALSAPTGGWVLRLTRLQDRGQAVRRHLEDRERLLFTSRAVSVVEMATTLAHDINQPLGTVTNVLHGLQVRIQRAIDAGRSVAPQDMVVLLQGLVLAIDQAGFASRIIGRIREYTPSRQPRRERVDMHALLRDSLALLDWELQRDGVQTTLATDPTLQGSSAACVLGDAVMLQQVIVNLLRNALDAMRACPTDRRQLHLSTQASRGHPTGDDIEIALRDTGCGMEADVERHLFVPFASTKPNGMGIGLSICRSFIELHQGRLWFSRNPDAGCTFHLALPLAPLHPTQDPAS